MTQSAQWRKSTYSDTQGNDCVELANLGPVVGIRDSKDIEKGHLTVSRRGLAALVTRIKRGELSM